MSGSRERRPGESKLPGPFRFSCPIRVRYSDVDRQGIVYYSRYLEYVDVGHTEYFRAVGFDYQALIEQEGFDPSVVKTTVEYRRPARFDEILQIRARVVAIGRTSFRMKFEIVREADGDLLASVEVSYVNFDKQTHSSRPVPEAVRRRVEAFEGTTLDASDASPLR